MGAWFRSSEGMDHFFRPMRHLRAWRDGSPGSRSNAFGGTPCLFLFYLPPFPNHVADKQFFQCLQVIYETGWITVIVCY